MCSTQSALQHGEQGLRSIRLLARRAANDCAARILRDAGHRTKQARAAQRHALSRWNDMERLHLLGIWAAWTHNARAMAADDPEMPRGGRARGVITDHGEAARAPSARNWYRPGAPALTGAEIGSWTTARCAGDWTAFINLRPRQPRAQRSA